MVGEFAVKFLRLIRQTPFFLFRIPLYPDLYRSVVYTIILDRYDFIEEACILRCHLDSHPEGFFGFRRSFVICGCCAAASGTYVYYHKGTVPSVFTSMVVCFISDLSNVPKSISV